MGDGGSAGHRAGRRAAKNTGVRAAAEVVGKLSTFLLFAVLARELGQSGLGAFVLAFAFLGIAMVPIALGCDTYMLREVAKDRLAADRLFFNVVALKGAMAVPVLTGCFFLVSALGYDERTRETVYVLAVGLMLDLLGKSLNGMFNAHERSGLLATALIVQRVTTASIGITALLAGAGVVTVAALYSVGSAVGLTASATLLARNVGVPARLVTPRRWRSLVSVSWPFAVQDVLTALLFKLDAVILSLLATEAAVGRYGAAYRLLEATMFVGWALNGAFVAMYAYLNRETRPSVGSVFGRSMKAALVLMTPVAVAFGLLAEPLVTLAFGSQFAAAAEPLRLLAPVVVGLCLVTLGSSLIVSRRDPRTMARLSGGAVAVNVALNLALIPSLEDRGAALAMLVTEAALVLAVLWVAAREVGGLHWRSVIAGPLVAGAAMAAPVALLASHPALAVAAGIAAYAAVLYAVERRTSPGDIKFVTALLRRRLPAA